MSKPTRLLFIVLISLIFLASGDQHSRAVNSPQSFNAKRIKFDVATFEEREGRRDLIAETTVEGPEGTDFNIKLAGARFQMNARFLTDLVAPDALKVRADLNTRRFYGQSERKLPLYEEDSQRQTLQLGFDEKMVLLPFGRNDGSDQLKIEISPILSDQTAYLESGQRRPLEIKILKASPEGVISVEASTIPHRFIVEAAIIEDGKEVARATSDALLEEAKELILKPNEQASREVIKPPLAVTLTVNQYMRTRPTDQVAIAFDAYQLSESAQRETPNFHGAGINEVGAYLNYDVTDYLKSSGSKYELRFKIKLAPGEDAN